MKQLILFFFLALSLASCTIRFDRFPNTTVDEFPKEMHGKYLFTNRQDNDSTYLIISAKKIIFTENKSLRGGHLSDSIKLAKGQKYYYLCLGDSLKDRFVWDVYPMKVSGKKLFMFALDADFYKKAIKKQFTPIGGFDDLYIMNEEKLDRFCKKKLKNKNALKMIKVE